MQVRRSPPTPVRELSVVFRRTCSSVVRRGYNSSQPTSCRHAASSQRIQSRREVQTGRDQPEAIEKMIDGIESGLASQTLLGVTGSGKSIGYDDPIYLVRSGDGEERIEIVRAGPFIDGLIESKSELTGQEESERYASVDAAYLTEAYDPSNGQSGLYRVGAFLRHRAPDQMFRLTTRCGRAVTLTGDHNLWVLRDGKPTLVRTTEVRSGDCLPTPDSIEATESLEYLDVIPYFADSHLSVFAEASVDRCIESGGRDKLVAGLRGVGLNPYAKLYAIRQRVGDPASRCVIIFVLSTMQASSETRPAMLRRRSAATNLRADCWHGST